MVLGSKGGVVWFCEGVAVVAQYRFHTAHRDTLTHAQCAKRHGRARKTCFWLGWQDE